MSRFMQFVRANFGWIVSFLAFYLLAALSVGLTNFNVDRLTGNLRDRGPLVVFGAASGAVFVFLIYRFFRFYLNPDD